MSVRSRSAPEASTLTKRKSPETKSVASDENSLNVSADNDRDAKKTKTQVADASSPLRRSALPRPSRSGLGTPSDEIKANSSSSRAETATALEKGTPSKVVGYLLGGAPKSTSKTTPAVQKKGTARTPAHVKLKQYFTNTITVTEETVKKAAHVTSEQKVKFKFDSTARIKHLEETVKNLKAAAVTLIGQVQQVEVQCCGYEDDQESILKECHFKIQELEQSNELLISSENRMKKDCSTAMEKAAVAEAALGGAKAESQPLRKTIQELESRISKLVVDHADEQAMAKTLKADSARLQKVEEELKRECNAAKAATLEEMKRAAVEFEQRLAAERETHRATLSKQELRADDATTALRKELTAARQELTAARQELTAARQDHGTLEQRLTKTESAREMAAAELARTAADLTAARAQLSSKESDLRSTHELQKALAEERGSLHTELAAAQVRLAALDQERHVTAAELSSKREQASTLSGELSATKETLAATQAALSNKEAELLVLHDASRQLETERENRERAERRESSERQERIAASAQLLATQTDCNFRIANLEKKMRTDIDSVKALQAQTQAELEVSVSRSREQCDTIMGLENEALELRAQLEHACANHETVEKLGRVSGELEILKRRLRESADAKQAEVLRAADRIRELEEEMRQSESTRRKLHNIIQELRGNVRVFARVRPYLPNDGIDLSSPPEPTIVNRTDGCSLRIFRQPSNEARGEDHAFSFDKVFGPSSSQEDVFSEVSEFVQSALDGYHVCLFSYGQTGSGKTHTMQGSGSGSMRGIISRAMEQVGRYKLELETKGWEYHMEVSFIEIYNETIRDLLRAGVTDDHKHEIKRDANGNTTVTDVTMRAVDPNDLDQMNAIMELAACHRSVGQTAMNERSSRSHSVFCLHLRASNVGQGIVLKGALNLVDLAGSERLDRSLATGARQTETVAINKSLSALTDVFVAIGNKQSHIPFRNSKLTYLLQPALSGDGKTLMMVNLSPTLESFGESVCSLRFASQVNQCELGKPKKQTQNDANATASATTPQTAKAPAKIGSSVSSASSSSATRTAPSSSLQSAKRVHR